LKSPRNDTGMDMTNLHRSPPMNQSKTDLGIVNESQLLRFGIRHANQESGVRLVEFSHADTCSCAANGVPLALTQFIKHNRVPYQRVVLVTVLIEAVRAVDGRANFFYSVLICWLIFNELFLSMLPR
jgi:hypothetical protein